MIRSIIQACTFTLLMIAMVAIISPERALAHCDTESGPVAEAVREALAQENFDLIAIWIAEEQEAELRARFDESIVVYNMGGQAGELAERFFMETAVRLHREAEGMPYTGVKPAQPLPLDVERAEEALRTGDPSPLIELLSSTLEEETRQWFQGALEAKNAYRGEDKDAGREWVDAYVKYVIYVHGIYNTIQAGPEHGVGHVE